MLAPRFSEYGIPIPLKMDRSQKVFSELSEHFTALQTVDLAALPQLSWEDVKLAHDLDFISRLLDQELSVNEVLHCYELTQKDLIDGLNQKPLYKMPEDVLFQCRGTYMAALSALKNEISFFLGGGMHHAMRFAGRGFCLLNDIVIAARKLQHDHGIRRCLIIDVDAHKGDGTTQITQNDDSIFTLSLHMKNAWPIDGSLGPGPWDLPSDLDIEFGIDEENLYLEKLTDALALVDIARFDFAFIILGADAWEHDELQSTQSLKLTSEQMLARDQLIESTLTQVKIKRAYVMGGGYGERAHEPYVNFLKKLFD